ncbi:hypothetical protein ACNKHK_11825 [Shigella flexneri]
MLCMAVPGWFRQMRWKQVDAIALPNWLREAVEGAKRSLRKCR